MRPHIAAAVGLAVGVVGAVAFAAGTELYHRERQLPILAVAGRDPGRAARLIAAQAPVTSGRCTTEATGRDGAALLSALAWVEGFARSPVERVVEDLVLRTASRLRIDPPDLSYGPLQIRLSTMRKVMPGGADGASILLQTCPARHVARLIIERELGVSLGAGSTLTRGQVLTAAAAFNGQAAPMADSATHAIAGRVYQETIYHLFQERRFAY